MSEFIAIEGGDGSGKATHSELFRKYAVGQIGDKVMKISFPQYGEKSAYYVERYLNGIYGDADSVHPELGILPYALDRFAASDTIRQHLATASNLVISDRYMASNLAHQGAKLPNEAERKAFYERTMETEYDILKIPRPTKNIVLLMPTTLAQQNVDSKAARSYTEQTRDIHEADANHLDRAKANYEELCRYYPDEFKAVICTDDSGAMRTLEDIQAEIQDLVELSK